METTTRQATSTVTWSISMTGQVIEGPSSWLPKRLTETT